MWFRRLRRLNRSRRERERRAGLRGLFFTPEMDGWVGSIIRALVKAVKNPDLFLAPSL